MNETLMIALLVLAGAGGMGSLGILGLSAKKIKKYKAEIRELRTAVIAHEKHLLGANLTYVNLYIYKSGILPYIYHWEKNDNYFKSVYRWNGVGNPNIKGKTVYFFDLIK